MAAAPALRHSPRDHAAGLRWREGISHARRSRNRCKGDSCDGPLTAGAHQRDFEGRRGERLRAGAHIEASITLRAPAAGPPPAGGDERGSTPRKSLCLATTATERYSDGPVATLGGLAGAC